MGDYQDYRQDLTSDIMSVVGGNSVQPVIFAGSGLSIRYFSGPNWDGLLDEMAGRCPKADQNYGYYRQKRSLPSMGRLIADWYAQWAWDRNEDKFANIDLDYDEAADIYLKMEIADYFDELTPDSVDDLEEDQLSDSLSLNQAQEEIRLLREIQPHAIITTNYDEFLERIFNAGNDEHEEDPYNVIVGEQVIRAQQQTVGEILKIHGSASKPESLILTDDDYDEFNDRKRYLSSKMLTYFAEHPVLIVGYSANDSNVQRILSWVNQVLPEDEEVAEDIYFLEYVRDLDSVDSFSKVKRIQLADDQYITVKRIIAQDFDWVFEAFASGDGFNVDLQILRKLLANTYEVVKSETPEAKVVDVKHVEEISKDSDKLATILGIAIEKGKFNFQFDHDYGPEEFYEEIGVRSPRMFKKKVLVPIWEKEGVNITSFNNKYHIAFFDRGAVEYRSFSEAAIELADSVMSGEDFDLGIPAEQIPDDLTMEGRGLDLNTVLDD